MFPAGDVEPQQRGYATGEIKIRIAVIDPAADPLAGAVGEWKVYIDDDAVVIQRDRDSAFRCRLKRILCQGCRYQNEDCQNPRLHRAIVAVPNT
jgi:hypothetical protein